MANGIVSVQLPDVVEVRPPVTDNGLGFVPIVPPTAAVEQSTSPADPPSMCHGLAEPENELFPATVAPASVFSVVAEAGGAVAAAAATEAARMVSARPPIGPAHQTQ
ncbi:MAG TPA: hypothetical protein VHF89_11470 [Solirubrobacteraceae bacterium]|nr:hypothetical protein [Solirubrobacteraceae bacterium]